MKVEQVEMLDIVSAMALLCGCFGVSGGCQGHAEESNCANGADVSHADVMLDLVNTTNLHLS